MTQKQITAAELCATVLQRWQGQGSTDNATRLTMRDKILVLQLFVELHACMQRHDKRLKRAYSSIADLAHLVPELFLESVPENRGLYARTRVFAAVRQAVPSTNAINAKLCEDLSSGNQLALYIETQSVEERARDGETERLYRLILGPRVQHLFTLVGFDETESRELASQLCALYGLELRTEQEQARIDLPSRRRARGAKAEVSSDQPPAERPSGEPRGTPEAAPTADIQAEPPSTRGTQPPEPTTKERVLRPLTDAEAQALEQLCRHTISRPSCTALDSREREAVLRIGRSLTLSTASNAQAVRVLLDLLDQACRGPSSKEAIHLARLGMYFGIDQRLRIHFRNELNQAPESSAA